ncbi:MAG: DUF1501 domain-containing protein [Planctomycetaceae bacterium]|nr:DUF1501 domain-containing protein [Planctomycetaceae bacterium]
MLDLNGSSYQLCDGLNRRSFLKLGGLAMGGISLEQLLRAEAAANMGSSHKAIIMVFLAGGPPHQDMFDLKMNAPVEIRGEFRPIATRVPGIDICEHMPKIAGMMDRLVPIRSVVGAEGRHDAFQCMHGWPTTNQPVGGWPSLGSVISKLQGPARKGMPPFVGLSPKMRNGTWADVGQPGFLGMAHAPFKPNADGTGNLTLNSDISLDQLGDRRQLLQKFDRLRADLDASGAMEGLDAFQQQAFGILTSSRLAEALDLDREDPVLRARYGMGSDLNAGYGDAGPLKNDYLLAARRLVEAGVRVVTLSYGRWDWHGRPHGTNFENARDHLPVLDQGLTTLLDDLKDRGMDKDVTVLVWGEFGRTPRINKKGGRDHWPRVSCALMSGGGLRGGQVIGATNRLGEYAIERPVHFQEIFATLYHNMGLDIDTATVDDLHGRPRYLIEHNANGPIREII